MPNDQHIPLILVNARVLLTYGKMVKLGFNCPLNATRNSLTMSSARCEALFFKKRCYNTFFVKILSWLVIITRSAPSSYYLLLNRNRASTIFCAIWCYAVLRPLATEDFWLKPCPKFNFNPNLNSRSKFVYLIDFWKTTAVQWTQVTYSTTQQSTPQRFIYLIIINPLVI